MATQDHKKTISEARHIGVKLQNTRSDSFEEVVELDLNEYIDNRDSLGYQVYPGTEPENYDYTAERHPVHGTNLIEATAHLIKGCLGAGVLSIHVGFMYAGIWTALATTIVMGIVITYTMMLLVRSAHKMYVRLRVPRLSYPDLAEAAVAVGPWKWLRKSSKAFRYLLEFCLVAEMCGSCCIYEIMIAQTLKHFLESISSLARDAEVNLRYYIICVAVPLIFLSLIRNLKYLAPVSFLADSIIGVCVFAAMYYSHNGGSVKDRPAWKNFGGLMKFCGVCLYSMDGITVVMPIENNMKAPKYCCLLLRYGMTVAILVVACIGFIGCWGCGETCRSPVTIHMPDETAPLIVQFLVATMLSVTFTVQFWVPFRIMWYYIGRRHHKNRGIWERFYRSSNVIIITAFAVAFPDLLKLMVFMGNFFLSLTVFIIPVAIETLVTWKDHRRGKIRWTIMRNVAIFAFGVIIFCGAFFSTI